MQNEKEGGRRPTVPPTPAPVEPTAVPAARRHIGPCGIIVLVVGLVLIVLLYVPVWALRHHSCGDPSRQAARDANMQIIHGALDEFYVAVGVYPNVLTDLSAESESGVSAATKAYPGYKPKGWKGPYLYLKTGSISGTFLPANPYKPQTETDVAKHWGYTPFGGRDYTLTAAP